MPDAASPSAPPVIRLDIALRWRDMDMLGHLNQAVYHEMLEEGRGALLQRLVTAAGGDHQHWSYVLARVELDYRAEVRKDHGTVTVVVTVGRVGGKSITLEHDVLLPDGTVAASGRSVLVGWDARTRGARELTAGERTALGAG